MICPYTIEMIEKLAVTDGTVKATTGGTKNGFVGAVNASHELAASTDGIGLALALNWGKGDDAYAEFETPAGEYLTTVDLEKWVGKEVQISPESIDYSGSVNYASISAGDKFVANASGNVGKVATVTATGAIYFEVTKKINFGGNGLLAKVCKK